MRGKLDVLRKTHAGIARRSRHNAYPSNLRRWRLRLDGAQWQSGAGQRAYSHEAAARRPPEDAKPKNDEEAEQGAMSRRLEEMTEESLAANPRRSAKTVAEAGFSEDLKRRLEQRIAAGSTSVEHPQAASIASMPSSAGQGTRDMAEARPWTGIEKMEETALRMLEDAHKPLRGTPGRRPPVKLPPVDLRLKSPSKGSAAERLANARDKTSLYSLAQDNTMSDKEKEEMRRILKERFQPSARPMPATVQGLQSLASERIEDAIARGLFKNIPRGKGVNVERDPAANSPFIDTTEYFMNKIIQKQEVLPPWVEKQQEVTRTIATFRARLRADWTRHAARMISSKGGTLEQQMRRAERYAQAEAAANPTRPKEETVSSIDPQGNLTRVTVRQTPPAAPADSPTVAAAAPTITVIEEATSHPPSAATSPSASDLTTTTTTSALSPASSPVPPPPTAEETLPPPFRDLDWEKTELAYHTLALTSLNNLTRSYNLMAPELARKPYFSLARELKACYAECAPLLPNEICARARAPRARTEQFGRLESGVLAKFGSGKVKVWESTRPTYGFREFLREWWRGKQKG